MMSMEFTHLAVGRSSCQAAVKRTEQMATTERTT
jgi:hypothetical protein